MQLSDTRMAINGIISFVHHVKGSRNPRMPQYSTNGTFEWPSAAGPVLVSEGIGGGEDVCAPVTYLTQRRLRFPLMCPQT